MRPRAADAAGAPASERALTPLKVAFLASLVALAAESRGAPSAASLLAVAFLLSVGIAGRVLAERRRSALRAVSVAVALAVLLVSGALLQMVRGADGRLAMPWVTLVGVPLTLAFTRREPTLVPRSRPLAWLLLVSLAAGTIGLEPWRTPLGSALLAAAALLGTLGAALDLGAGAAAKGLPPPTRPERRRSAATAAFVALAVILLAATVDALLAPLPRPWNEPDAAPPASDRLAQQLPSRAPGAPRAADVDRGVALVRVVEGDEPPPDRLYLRGSVLDLPVEREGVLFLGPREGGALEPRDGDDGREDHQVHWPESRPESIHVERETGLTFQVTLLNDAQAELLVVPRPRWLEGTLLSIAADGAIARPTAVAGSFTYRTAGSPASAFSRPAIERTAATSDAERLALPTTFEGRRVLAALLRDLPGDLDGWGRAEAIAELLRRTGRFDLSAPFRDWAGFAASRRGSSLHFAQCFALLARLAGLPARVAVGYACREYDTKDRRFDVRFGDRRYWGEVELEGIGWVDFDPCPEASAAASAPPGSLAERTDAQSVRTTLVQERPLLVGLLVLVFVALLLAFPTLRLEVEKLASRRAPGRFSPPARRAWRFWQELIDCCRRFGLEADPAQTAEEFARLVRAAAPGEGAGVVTLLRVYHGCRFGGADLGPDEERSSRELLARLPTALQSWKSARGAGDPLRR